MTAYNPLHWKRRHLVGAAGLILLAGAAGAAAGDYYAFRLLSRYAADPFAAEFAGIYLARRVAFGALAASAAATVIYCIQLFRD